MNPDAVRPEPSRQDEVDGEAERIEIAYEVQLLRRTLRGDPFDDLRGSNAVATQERETAWHLLGIDPNEAARLRYEERSSRASSGLGAAGRIRGVPTTER
jgi:hypothetical protein